MKATKHTVGCHVHKAAAPCTQCNSDIHKVEGAVVGHGAAPDGLLDVPVAVEGGYQRVRNHRRRAPSRQDAVQAWVVTLQRTGAPHTLPLPESLQRQVHVVLSPAMRICSRTTSASQLVSSSSQVCQVGQLVQGHMLLLLRVQLPLLREQLVRGQLLRQGLLWRGQGLLRVRQRVGTLRVRQRVGTLRRMQTICTAGAHLSASAPRCTCAADRTLGGCHR